MPEEKIDHGAIMRRIEKLDSDHKERHEEADKKWTTRFDSLDEKVVAQGKQIEQAKGGLAVGKWVVSVLIALAGLFGLAEYFKH